MRRREGGGVGGGGGERDTERTLPGKGLFASYIEMPHILIRS